MDERQTQIRQGAGLEESRINTEFLDFLNKWSSPVLIVIGLIGLGWFGLNYLERTKQARLNNAFAAYEGAVSGGAPSPASLRNIAGEYSGVGAVGELALLRTVDLYLRAAIAGVEPGAEIDPATGFPANESDRLDAERTQSYLSQARDLSRQVVQAVEQEEGRRLMLVQALMRMGAAEEGLGQIDQARASYARAGEVARDAGFAELGTVADRMVAMADRAAAGVSLPSREALPELPGERFVDPAGDLPMTIDDIMSLPAFQNLQEGGAGADEPAGEPAVDPASGDEPQPAAEPAAASDPAP
ncbi:hypothetical protein [Nodularia spumigena]|uniref:hypothetical protein n=1 Tax=Nodularia spumigena TaxID=70799 RepID=UPI002B1EE0A7|nr:hypothetical protein [Nodularia spumigena]MEA5612305.1 hypothetical protein [Nodularia spumigena UHCC 0040]